MGKALHWSEARDQGLDALGLIPSFQFPPIDVFKMAGDLDIPLYSSEADGFFDAITYVAKDTKEARIVYNERLPVIQQRVCIAREIGYLVERPLRDNPLSDMRKVKKRLGFHSSNISTPFFKKSLRSRFSTELLMPDYMVRFWLHYLSYDVKKMAQLFHVPETMMGERLLELLPELFLTP